MFYKDSLILAPAKLDGLEKPAFNRHQLNDKTVIDVDGRLENDIFLNEHLRTRRQ